MKTTKTETGKGSIPTDKRTKAYKEWVKKHSKGAKGLGDKIEKVTKATGIKKAVDTVFDALGKDCGCDKRKAKLKKNTFLAEEVTRYSKIYERIFNTRISCQPCSFRSTVWKSLLNVYNQYS